MMVDIELNLLINKINKELNYTVLVNIELNLFIKKILIKN